jgi:DNA (cytosine-5)-methyltransferase 1
LVVYSCAYLIIIDHPKIINSHAGGEGGDLSYISCFSGIGGLEGSVPPSHVCEIDPECQKILRRRYPNVAVVEDVTNFKGVSGDILVGGWPCQDLSIAGRQKGLNGSNSSLFYSFLEVAEESGSHTVIAENVTNLLQLERGMVFKEVIHEFLRKGFHNIAWRILNARNFGLPHHRNRIFFIASKHSNISQTIFREIPKYDSSPTLNVAGFYWTAGTQSICYSKGYVPTIKVGSSLSIPSPPAVHFENVVRKISTYESLALQGFKASDFESTQKKGDLYRMAGNAVAIPVGNFVVDGVVKELLSENHSKKRQQGLFDDEPNWANLPAAGFFDGDLWEVECIPPFSLACNLSDFIDHNDRSMLSARASSGLLRRLTASGMKCPKSLRQILMAA